MTGGLAEVEFVIKTVAQAAIDNEVPFGELDAVVGDGDFGYSLARGFENVLTEFDTFERNDPGQFIMKVAQCLSARLGGTSGPIWGTAFLRAGKQLKGSASFGGADVVTALRASVEGIKARGGAELGEKTLLDSLVPAIDTLEQEITSGSDGATCLDRMAASALEAAEATAGMQARRGRASYTGERSVGSVDAGAMGVAVLLRTLADSWSARTPTPQP